MTVLFDREYDVPCPSFGIHEYMECLAEIYACHVDQIDEMEWNGRPLDMVEIHASLIYHNRMSYWENFASGGEQWALELIEELENRYGN